MRRPTRKGERADERPRPDAVRREPLPLARAILWQPLPDSYHLLASMMRAPEKQAQLFVTQRAFLQVERHLASAPDLELGGFLAGHVCECPRSRTRYSVVNTVIPFADVSEDPLGARVTQAAFDKVRKRLDAHALALIGWYRNGRDLGLQLLPDDIETHLAYFNEPLQTTMIVTPDASRPKGAFFTYDPRVGRGYCIPFYELFDETAVRSNRLDRTCVAWTTYVASKPVQPLAGRDREIVEATVMPMRPSAPEPQPTKPIDEWWDAIKDPWVRLKDVSLGGGRREESTRLESEAVPRTEEPAPTPVRLPERPAAIVQDRRLPDEAPVATRVPPTARPTEQARSRSAGPAPPFTGAPRLPSSAATREAPAPTPPRNSVPGSGPRAAARPTPTTPLQTGMAGGGPAASVQAQPFQIYYLKPGTSPSDSLMDQPWDSPHDPIRRARRRRIAFFVAVASLLAASAMSTVRSRAALPPVKPAPAAAFDTTPAVAPGATGQTAIPLTAAVDSLSAVLAYYREIEGAHRGGTVSCRALGRAYAAVGRARVRLASSRQQIAGSLADSDSIRVSMLAAEYTFVSETYQRSGCRR